MVDPITGRTLLYRALFAAIVVGVTFARMMPIGTTAGVLPGPDILIALTCAWVLRRPAYVPAPFLVLLFLFADIMCHLPPGLTALTVLAGTEVLRARQGVLRELPFPAEWAMVTAAILAMAVLSNLILVVLVTDRPPLGLQLVRALFTAAIYPLAVLVTAHLLGIRKPTPGEVDALGARL